MNFNVKKKAVIDAKKLKKLGAILVVPDDLSGYDDEELKSMKKVIKQQIIRNAKKILLCGAGLIACLGIMSLPFVSPGIMASIMESITHWMEMPGFIGFIGLGCGLFLPFVAGMGVPCVALWCFGEIYFEKYVELSDGIYDLKRLNKEIGKNFTRKGKRNKNIKSNDNEEYIVKMAEHVIGSNPNIEKETNELLNEAEEVLKQDDKEKLNKKLEVINEFGQSGEYDQAMIDSQKEQAIKEYLNSTISDGLNYAESETIALLQQGLEEGSIEDQISEDLNEAKGKGFQKTR